jgi:hypothetical protein
MAQMVEHLLCKHEALCSKPSFTRKKKKEEEGEGEGEREREREKKRKKKENNQACSNEL